MIEYFNSLYLNLFMCSFGRIASLDMPTAVNHLRESDPELQVLGAAYIQHECYNDSEAKNAVLFLSPFRRNSVMKIVLNENCFPSK